MDIQILAGANCVSLSNETFPLNSLEIKDKHDDFIQIRRMSNGSTIHDAPWQDFKDTDNARYSSKADVIAALKNLFYGAIL